MNSLSRASFRNPVAFSLVVLVVGSVPAFGTLFLNDMDFYSLFADKMLSGHLLYRDALDVKPPLIFLHYAALFRIFGVNNVTAVKVVTVGWLGLSGMVMVALRHALSPRAPTPRWTAFLFLLASFSGWGEEFLSSNSEVLANLFILVGVWQLASADMSSRAGALIVGGASIGIAFLYRYQSAAALAAYLTTMLVRRGLLDRKARRMLLVGVGFSLPSVLFVAYFAGRGAIADLRLMVALQLHYASDVDSFRLAVLLGRLAIAMGGLCPLMALAAMQVNAIARRWARASKGEIFMLAFLGWSLAGFLAGSRLRPHYFVQVIPALVLLAAERLDGMPHQKHWPQRHAVAIQTLLAFAFAIANGTYYWTSRNAVPNADVVAFVEANSQPTDEVLLWIWRPDVLFQAHRRFASRLLVNSPLLGQFDARLTRAGRRSVRRGGLPELWPVLLSDLTTNRPKIIIDDPPGRSEWSMDRYEQFRILLAGYHGCQVMDDACVYLRRD